jgi:DNA end-binding protein Ku
MRAIWKGAIAFGLVNIPVKLFSASQGSELDLDMLDSKDHGRIRFRRVNENTGKEVPYERIVRAYNNEGRYVVVSDEDMKKAAAEKTGTISIQEFIPEEQVPGKYFEKPYYLAPEKSGARAYVLLREALKKSKKVAVASFVMRTKEHPGLLVPDGDVIILNQLRFAEEVRDPADLDIPRDMKIPPAELKLALSLIDQGTGEFDITRYKDTYSEQLMKMIHAKAKGKKIPEKELKVVHTKSDDLMEQLRASLDTRKKKAS